MSIFWNIGPLYRSYYPDSLIGMTAVQAEEKIADWQLYSIGRSWAPHPFVPEGMVIGVCPRQYDSLSVTTAVRILVSTGWHGLPRFEGMMLDDAILLAEEKNLVPQVVEERETQDILLDGMVIEQLQPPGSQYSSGDTVQLIVGKANTDWGTW